MTTKDFLEPAFLLFARRLASVPPFPADNDGIKFNFALNRWELAPFGGAGEANTSSNVGTGAGLALPKVGVDLPFKSLTAGAGITITPSPTEILIAVTNPSKIIELARTVLTVSSSNLVVDFSGNTKKNLLIYSYVIPVGGTIRLDCRFNQDALTNYAERFAQNFPDGGGQQTNQDEIDLSNGAENLPMAVEGWIRNISSGEKLGNYRTVGVSNAGEANAPDERQTSFKWDNLVSQIDEIEFLNNGGTGSFDVGSFLIVCGFD